MRMYDEALIVASVLAEFGAPCYVVRSSSYRTARHNVYGLQRREGVKVANVSKLVDEIDEALPVLGDDGCGDTRARGLRLRRSCRACGSCRAGRTRITVNSVFAVNSVDACGSCWPNWSSRASRSLRPLRALYALRVRTLTLAGRTLRSGRSLRSA